MSPSSSLELLWRQAWVSWGNTRSRLGKVSRTDLDRSWTCGSARGRAVLLKGGVMLRRTAVLCLCLDVCVCLDAWIISDSFLTHGCLTCGWGEACLGYGRGVEGVGPRLSGADADVSSTEEASGSRLLATSAASPLAESLSTQHRLCAVCSFFMLRIEVHASYVKSLHYACQRLGCCHGGR